MAASSLPLISDALAETILNIGRGPVPVAAQLHASLAVEGIDDAANRLLGLQARTRDRAKREMLRTALAHLARAKRLTEEALS